MTYRQRLFLLGALDSLIISGAVLLALFNRFDFHLKPQYAPFLKAIPYVVLIFVVLSQVAFQWVKLYRRLWQYASIGEFVSVVKAITATVIGSYLFITIVNEWIPTLVAPRSIYISSWFYTIIGIMGTRLVWRMIRDSYSKLQPHHRRTLIIGAGDAGVLVARELKHSPTTELYPVAFIDDDMSKQGLEVVGLPVLGGRSEIPNVVEKFGIQRIIIALPSVSKNETSQIIEICARTKAKVQILPNVSDLISGKISTNMIREVSIEDLLGREPVMVDLDGIATYVTDQVVLVTGAGGSIGSELCRQISPFSPKKLLLLGHGENSIYEIELELRATFPNVALETIIADIQDRQRMQEVFRVFRPSLVFHAAAHKHVPLMERNPAEAVKNNVVGTKNVAECAHEFGAARFVMISSDKAVNPTSVMGTTKRVAEMMIQSLDRISETKFVAVRFGNVLGSRGSVIPIFKNQIKAGGPVTVTHPEMIRYFMTIPEAVQLVIQAGALASGGEIFILDMGKPVKIADLARDLIRLSGFEPDRDIKIVYTGIRTGEKLFEELLTNEEGTTSTKHDRIFIGKPLKINWDELKFLVRKLESVVSKSNPQNQSDEIKILLKSIVPTYHNDRDQQLSEIKQAMAEVATSLE